MSINLVVGIVVGALLLARILSRQLQGSMVTRRSLVLVPVILVVVGVAAARLAVGTASYGELAFFGYELTALVLIGFARGASIRLTSPGGVLHQHGTQATIALWLLTIAFRCGSGFAGAALGLDDSLALAGLLLGLGLTLAAQNAVVYLRAERPQLPFAVRSARIS